MPTIIGSICRAATRKDDEPLNILTFPTHERYETGLAKTGHNFFAWRQQGIKDWNETYAPRPVNYHLLSGSLPIDVDFDLILSQNKAGQYQVARTFAQQLHLPIISLEHTLPPLEYLQELNSIKQMRGNLNVFISEYSRSAWGWQPEEAQVIHHGIDVNVFKPNPEINREIQVLSVVNDFANRDWCCGFNLWREITNGLPTKLVGDNPGLSKAAQSVDELIKAYQECRVFLNTSLVSPVPTVMLEAMACGTPVVSTANCMIPQIIQHGVNGFISNDPQELREYTELLLDDEEVGRKLGEAARETILEKFHIDRFINDWQKAFAQVKNMIYTGEY